MFQTPAHSQSTQKVMKRLQAEGWVECPGLGFPALAQHLISDLRAFVLDQLHKSGGRIGLADLQLAVLIFSVPTHQYEVHPHLPLMLKRLEAEGMLEISKPGSLVARATQSEGMVQLRAARHRHFG
jgi:hypothetical protein